MNNRQKMYITNTKIKKFLIEKSFKNLYFFPHLRFSKDYIFDAEGFDAIGWNNKSKKCHLFQFKTNRPPSKKTLKKYNKIAKKYSIVLCWITRFDKKHRTKKYSEEIIMWKIK